MTEYLTAVLLAALINQAFLARFCAAPAEDPIRDAVKNGGAVVLLLTASSAVSVLLADRVLAPLGLESLNLLLFLLVIGLCAWLLGEFLRINAPAAYASLEGAVRGAGLNALVLGGLLSAAGTGAGFAAAVLTAFGASVVYTAVSVVMAGILARIDEADLPAPVRGVPVIFLSAALISMALLSLTGLSF